MRKRLLALMGCAGSIEAARNTAGPRPVASLIPVLLISLSEAETSSVREFLNGTRFLPVRAENLEQSTRLLSQIVFPIVVYDPAPHISEWQTDLGHFVRGWRRPMMLFLAGGEKANFPEHSVCPAAINILVRPFQASSLIAALDLAYRTWSEGFANSGNDCRAMAAASASSGFCKQLPGCIVPSE